MGTRYLWVVAFGQMMSRLDSQSHKWDFGSGGTPILWVETK